MSSNRIARASNIFPDDQEDDFLLSDQESQEELNRITDYATAVIFQQASPEAEVIVFPVSRLEVQNVFRRLSRVNEPGRHGGNLQ